MKIAICDDCLEYRSVIAKRLKSLDLIEDISYFEFSCSEDLLYAYNLGTRFDVIFLDVEMGAINGVDAGVKIREMDEKVIIIFVSNYPQYAIPAYDCEAFYFVVKPIESCKFDKVICKAIEKYKILHSDYVIKNRGDITKIPIKEILYVEIYRKHLIFHTTSGNYETIGKISEALDKLKPYGFCQVHQGYLVNMNHINGFSNYDVIIDNGEKVMISVRKKSEVLKIYADYLGRIY